SLVVQDRHSSVWAARVTASGREFGRGRLGSFAAEGACTPPTERRSCCSPARRPRPAAAAPPVGSLPLASRSSLAFASRHDRRRSGVAGDEVLMAESFPIMYTGRPSASPVLAGLILAGVIRRSHAILDLGCGDGTDCFALAAWGARRVDGLEWDEEAFEKAN